MSTGDELRASFVLDGTYWGAAGFLREEGDPPFTGRDVGVLTSLADVTGELLRRATLVVARRYSPFVAGSTSQNCVRESDVGWRPAVAPSLRKPYGNFTSILEPRPLPPRNPPCASTPSP